MTGETSAGEAHGVRGRHYRRMLHHGAIYGLGSLANRLAGFVLLPLYTRVIPPDELGLLWVMVAAGGFLSTLLNMGMSSAIFRFYFESETDRNRDHVVTSAFTAVSLVSVSMLAGLRFLRGPISSLLTGSVAHASFVDMMLLGVFFDVSLFVPLSVLRAQERSMRFTALAIVRFVVAVALSTWLVVGLDMGALGVLAAGAITSAVVFLVVLREIVSRLRAGPQLPVVRGLLRFGLPIMLATIGSFLVDSSDLWLLRGFRGLEEVSRYGTVYRIAKILQVVIIQPFILAWPAVMWSVARRPEAGVVYARTLTYAVSVIAFAALGVSLFRRELITIISTDAYVSAAWVLPWIAFSLVLLLSTYVLNSGIALSGRTEFLAWTMAASLSVNVGLNLLLIPEFGMRGAAVSTFVAYAVTAAGMAFFGNRLHPIAWDWGRLARVAVIAGVLLFVGLSCESISGLRGFGARAFAWLAFPALVATPLVMTAAERGAALDLWARARKRVRA